MLAVSSVMMHVFSWDSLTEVVTDAKIPDGRDPSRHSVGFSSQFLCLNTTLPSFTTAVVSISVSRVVGTCRGFWELMQALLSTKLNGHLRIQLNWSSFFFRFAGIFLKPVLLLYLCRLKSCFWCSKLLKACLVFFLFALSCAHSLFVRGRFCCLAVTAAQQPLLFFYKFDWILTIYT